MATRIPGYRGLLSVFFDGIVSMRNPYPKPWKFRVRRIFQGWDGAVFAPAYAMIQLDGTQNAGDAATGEFSKSSRVIKAMNPAVVIYECLTNRVWGRGLARTRIDEASFLECAQTLYVEGFGLCIKWARQETIQQFIQAILDTIGATLNADRRTGLLKLKLIRADYTFSSLPVFDADSGLLEVSEATVSSPSSLVSECVVNFRDPITDRDRKVKASNVAVNQTLQGGSNTITREYRGIPTVGLALRVAQRDLRMASATLRRFSVTLDRRAWNVYPGDVIRIRDLARGIPDTAVRVGRYEDGTFTDGRIKVTAVQDVFGLPQTSFVGSTPPQWSQPTNTPCIGRHRAFEMPYVALVRGMSPANFNAINEESAFIGTVMAQGQTANLAYEVVLKTGAPDLSEEPPDQSYFCGFQG